MSNYGKLGSAALTSATYTPVYSSASTGITMTTCNINVVNTGAATATVADDRKRTGNSQGRAAAGTGRACRGTGLAGVADPASGESGIETRHSDGGNRETFIGSGSEGKRSLTVVLLVCRNS